MYTRRAAVVTFKSLRPLFNIGRTGAPVSPISVNVLCFLRNFGTATERLDIYNTLDVNVAAGNQTFQSIYNENGSSYGKNLGGVAENLNQNPSRVYERSLNGEYGDNAGNRFGYNSGDRNSRFHGGNLDASELNGNPNRLYGQNFDVQRGNFASSDSQVHNFGNYYNNGSQIPIDMNPIVEPVEETQPRGPISDLDDFIKEGKLKEAVELLEVLQNEGVQLELPRYMALIALCGEYEALNEARSVHGHLVKSGAHLEVRTYNRIVEMYSKCGSMYDAFEVFDQMPQRNMSSWDIMIYWLARNGHGEDSIDLFAELKSSGLKPDGETFMNVFFACGVLCDTVEGMLHFESMVKDYEIVPTMEHYIGIVDMFGNAGYLDGALQFIHNLPIEPSIDIWETLMKFCRIHGDVELGDHCANLIEHLDPSRLNNQSRAGLISIDASDSVKEKQKRKLNGNNLMAVRSSVHHYRAGDRSQPGLEGLYLLLWGLKQQMKEIGYVPQIRFVLHDVDQEAREEALMAHSERLAAAQGLLTSTARSPMRVVKNLRFCVDCHNVFKLISKIAGREIVVRDTKRYHHFKDGWCNCNDYW